MPWPGNAPRLTGSAGWPVSWWRVSSRHRCSCAYCHRIRRCEKERSVPEFTCSTCGKTFTLPAHILDKYPGWTPRQCRSCRDATGAGNKRGKRAPVEENLTLAQVLKKYTAGPQDGVFTDGSANQIGR